MVQDKELVRPKKNTLSDYLILGFKIATTIFILYYILNTFRKEDKNLLDIYKIFGVIFIPTNYVAFGMVILMVPLNWTLEAKKWRVLVQRLTPISFRNAFIGVLSGLAVGVFLPAQIGDTVGRIGSLKSEKRFEAIGAAIISSGIQFYVSILGGAVAWFILDDKIVLIDYSKTLIKLALGLIVIIGIIFIIFRKRIVPCIPAYQFLSKLKSYTAVVSNYHNKELLKAFLYGTLRYVVFLTQFVIILSMFHFDIKTIELAACVGIIYLAKTVIPMFNILGDLGLREFTALFIFQEFNLPADKIITATLFIWLINVLGPLIAGLYFIWKKNFMDHKFNSQNI